MLLGELIEGLSVRGVFGPLMRRVDGICYHSGQARANYLFVAIPGLGTDGHKYVAEAAKAGACAAVISSGREGELVGLPLTLVSVDDTRLALAQLSGRFFNHPSLSIGLIGVTGTNGKTTVTYLIESILKAWGEEVGVIGTINYRYKGRTFPPLTTTPESLDLQRLLREMVDEGVRWVVLEVSSHALDLKRVHGCHLDGAVFTNLSQDHLDYHLTMDNYFKAKLKLFTELLRDSGKRDRFALVNLDDPRGHQVASQSAIPPLTYGLKNGTDIRPWEVEMGEWGIRGKIATPKGVVPFDSSLIGEFNLYNIMAAVGVAVALDVPFKAIREGIESLGGVPGRLERVDEGQDFTVLIDYAHTPDALERALKVTRNFCRGRLIVVFGCGGNRDRGKRPIMGRVSAQLADISIITSDNPRLEEPEAIISDILIGFEGTGAPELTEIKGARKGYIPIADRGEAIRQAVKMAEAGDLILIAGKGHEDYQVIGNKRVHFDDREEARAAIRAR